MKREEAETNAFVSPVYVEVENGQRMHKVGYMQSGQLQPLVFSYISAEIALEARRSLYSATNTFSLPSLHAFQGVCKGLVQAYQQGQNKSESHSQGEDTGDSENSVHDEPGDDPGDNPQTYDEFLSGKIQKP